MHNLVAFLCFDLARPRVLLDPPVPSGTYVIDQGAGASLNCAVNNAFTHPDVIQLLASNT